MSKLLEAFGKRIRKLRHDRKISQEKLAELATLHRTYIGQIETGVRNLSLKNIEKLSKALKVKIKDLFDFDIK